MTTTTIKKCTRCNGSGKVPFTVDNGICYKCEGQGYIGDEDEISKAIAEREIRNALPIALKAIKNHLAPKVGASIGYNDFYQMALCGATGKSFEIVSAKFAPLFITPYVDNYSYVHTCENPDKYMVKNQEKLAGRFTRITSNGKMILIEFL